MQPRIQMTSIDVIASALEPVTPALSRMSSPDGAVTLMLSDIADAGAAAENLGSERWEQLVRDHHLLVERLARTQRFWQEWLKHGTFPDHPWRTYLQRSALTLKGLTYAPSGALIAAYVVGYLETITAYLISPAYRTIPALLLLILVMYVRPRGLLGRR